MSDTENNTPQALEADERFPSGEWRGFWIQKSIPGAKKGWMELLLLFKGGQLRGEGQDRYGEFFLRGQYDLESGEVTFHKTYPGYDIFYRGWAELDKGIWGLWKLPDDQDGFQIWPKGMADPTGSTLKEEADLPLVLVEQGSGGGVFESAG